MEDADARLEGAERTKGAEYMSSLAHAILIVEGAKQEELGSELGRARKTISSAASDLLTALEMFRWVPEIQQILDAKSTVATMAGNAMPDYLVVGRTELPQGS
jgi:hypothetical protein